MAVLIGTAAALGAKALVGKLGAKMAAKGAAKALAKGSGAGGPGGGGEGMGNPAGVFLGAGQTIAGLLGRKKADGLVPSVVDPRQQALLEDIKSQRRSIQTGTGDPSLTAARQISATMSRNAFKTGGVNLAPVTASMGQTLANIAANRNQELMAATQLEKSATDDMAQRKLEIGMLRQQQASARAEQNISGGQDNLAASISDEKFQAKRKAKQLQKKNKVDNT